MANRRRGLLGGLVCFVLGAVIGVCALAGVLVWVVKLGTINKVTGREIVGSTEVDGETVDLKDMTVWDIITKASSLGDTSKKMTLKNVEELLPALNLTDMLPAEMLNEDKTALSIRYNGTEILTVSLDELYSQQFSSIAKYVEATVKNNLKFSTLTAVGMNLDAFPFVRGYVGSDAANPGKEVPTYVSLGTGTIGEYYKNHPASVYYIAEDGAYHTATDAMISRTDGDQTALYFKAIGLSDLPILDGINAIVATLDVDTLTLDAMNDKFGLNLTDEEGNYKNAVLAKISDIRVSHFADEIDNVMNRLYLSDVLTGLEEDDVLYPLQFLRYTKDTAAEYNAAHAEEIAAGTKSAVQPGDFAYDENGKKVQASINQLSGNISYLKVKDLINNPDGNALIAALGDYTVDDLQNKADTIVDGLYLSDVMNISQDNMMAAFEYMRYTDLKNEDGTPKEGSAQAYNDAHAAEIAAGTKAAVKPGDYVLDENDNKVKTPVGKLSEIIDYVKVKDLIKNDSNNEMVSALGEYTLKELRTDADGIMDDLALSDVIEIKPTDTALSALQYLRFTEETAADYNTEHAAEITAGTASAVKAGDKIPVWENGRVKKDEEDNIVYTLTTIKTLSGNVNNVPMGDLLGVTEGSEPVLKAIRYATINTLNDTVKTLTLADVMTIDESNAALNALQYLRFTEKTAAEYNTEHAAEIAAGTASAVKAGDKIPVWENGVIKTDEAGNIVYRKAKVNELGDNINNVKMGDLLNVTEGSEPILRAISGATVNTLNDTVKTLTLADVMTIETDPAKPGYSKILVSLQGEKITDLGSATNRLTLADAIDIETDPNKAGYSKILVSLQNSKVTELGSATSGLTLADAIDIETDESSPNYSKTLIALKDAKLTELGTKIPALTLGEMLPYDESGTTFYDKLMKQDAIRNATANTAGTAISNVKIASLFDVYEADGGELKGIWYFVLSGNESLNDLDGVMANAPTKFGSAKLGDLARKGLLGDIQESDLNASVKNMTLNEAIKAFNSAASSGLIGG